MEIWNDELNFAVSKVSKIDKADFILRQNQQKVRGLQQRYYSSIL